VLVRKVVSRPVSGGDSNHHHLGIQDSWSLYHPTPYRCHMAELSLCSTSPVRDIIKCTIRAPVHNIRKCRQGERSFRYWRRFTSFTLGETLSVEEAYPSHQHGTAVDY
jgi:hypothetical protein